MSIRMRWRLAAMMVLVYAVQGAFWPLLAIHLGDLGISSRERGWIFATLALASLAMPLGAGHLVDRLMSIQRYLAIVFALGAGFLVAFALGVSDRAGPLFLLFLAYWLITAPAYGLSNALALRNLGHPHEEFGGVRLWGTVGWMAAGWLVSGVMAGTGSTRVGQGAFEAFGVSAGLSVVLAVYCLTLPDTPPLAVDERCESGPREGLEFVRQPGMAVFLLTAFGVCLTLPFVYQVIPSYLESRGLARAWVSTAMTLGQAPEIAALALMSRLLRRVHYRGLLALGITAWAVRFASLALDPPLAIAVAGIALHGVGVACFSIGGQVFIDTRAPAHRRASAQSLYVVLTAGIGSLLGSLLAGEVVSRFPGNYETIFLVPCFINVVLLASFFLGFRPDAVPQEKVEVAARSGLDW